MRIRKALNADVNQIQQLYSQLDAHHADIVAHVFKHVPGTARPDKLLSDWVDGDDSDYLVAESDRGIVGFIDVRVTSDPPYPMFHGYPFVEISNAVVDESYRGQGIGSRLFAAAIQWAKDRGLAHIRTSVWHENEKALQFYTDQGFKPLTVRMELAID